MRTRDARRSAWLEQLDAALDSHSYPLVVAVAVVVFGCRDKTLLEIKHYSFVFLLPSPSFFFLLR
jgi:hypothetical protein